MNHPTPTPHPNSALATQGTPTLVPTLTHLGFLIALLATLVLAVPAHADTPNVLFILIDDLGIEHLSSWGVGTDTTPAPNIDSISAAGLRFDNAWANPYCSPTRASVLTGRHPVRTGVTWFLDDPHQQGLSLDETTLPEALANAGYRSGAFGKWHLGIQAAMRATPNAHGFDHFEGVLLAEQPSGDFYTTWKKTVNGASGGEQSGYVTQAVRQWAVRWIEDQTDPWFAYVAFPSVHDPFHCPPETYAIACEETESDFLKYQAMIRALDVEIGTLLAAVDLSDTLVIFASDNGSPEEVAQSPYSEDRAKGTAFEGGVRVPLAIFGGPVETSGVITDGVQLADIFATVLTTVGLASEAEDSTSLEPYFYSLDAEAVRQYSMTEAYGPQEGRPAYGQVAARDETYKLIIDLDGTEYFYNWSVDPHEGNDLRSDLEADALVAYGELRSYIMEIHN